MTLATKVQAAVDKAFTRVDSLLKTATFSNKSVSGFNFSTEAVNATNSSFTVKGLVENTTKKIDGKVTAVKTLFMKTGGIVFSNYTTVTIDSEVYNCSVYKGDDYTTTLLLVKTQ